MNKLAEALKAAADRITPKGSWTQKAVARDSKGRELADADSNAAVCWCGLGSLSREARARGVGFEEACAAVFPDVVLPDDRIIRFNDFEGRHQEEVVALLRGASERELLK